MTAAEALALHQDVQVIQQQLITALAGDEPDLPQCQLYVTQIDTLLGHIAPVEQLTDLTEQRREELLRAAKTTEQLLQSYCDTVMHMRHAHTSTQMRVERDSAAIRRYQPQITAEAPKFLDEKR